MIAAEYRSLVERMAKAFRESLGSEAEGAKEMKVRGDMPALG